MTATAAGDVIRFDHFDAALPQARDDGPIITANQRRVRLPGASKITLHP
jgi:hypothetical protein